MLKTITLTFAQSIDGRIATSSGESRYISEEGSLKINQKMRRDHDALLVGIGTVLADDPLLTYRLEPQKSPVRLILDPSLRLPAESRIARTAGEYKTLVFFDKSNNDIEKPAFIERMRMLESLDIELKGITGSADGNLSLEEVIDQLDAAGIESLMVEGGSSILTSFLSNEIWTDMVIVSAAKIIGNGIPSFGNLGVRSLSEVIKPVVKNISILGSEVCWHLLKAGKCEPVSAKTVYFTAADTVEVRTDTIAPPDEEHALFNSRLMAISPGTERQIYKGNFIRGKKADPSIDCTEGEFCYPFSYGYINVVEDSSGERYFGFMHHADKVFARREDLHRLDSSINDETALFIPHMETAVSIIHDTKPKLGDRVLITGAGIIGTLTYRILSGLMGIETIVFDINPEKEIWFPADDFFSERDALMNEVPFDLCIDASGSPGGLQTCIENSQMEGSITIASWYGERQIPINLGGGFHWKRLKLVSSQVSNLPQSLGHNWNKKRRFNLVSELLGKIKTDDLLTHRYMIDDAPEAYKLIGSDKAFYGLIALVPGG